MFGKFFYRVGSTYVLMYPLVKGQTPTPTRRGLQCLCRRYQVKSSFTYSFVVVVIMSFSVKFYTEFFQKY